MGQVDRNEISGLIWSAHLGLHHHQNGMSGDYIDQPEEAVIATRHALRDYLARASYHFFRKLLRVAEREQVERRKVAR